MVQALVFKLVAPMASWGAVAVGESRHSDSHPGRSAILGLLAAALGIDREDDAAHARLGAACRLGVKVMAPGFPLRDYHTVQKPPEARKPRYRTRRQALTWPARNKLDTFLSAREYRMGMAATVAVLATPGRATDAPTLQQLMEALRTPFFPLYLGRRSCPPGAPLAPRVDDFASLKAALDAFDHHLLAGLLPTEMPDPAHAVQHIGGIGAPAFHYYWDTTLGANGLAPDAPAMLTLTHHDEPLSRVRRQFAPRQEYMHTQVPA